MDDFDFTVSIRQCDHDPESWEWFIKEVKSQRQYSSFVGSPEKQSHAECISDLSRFMEAYLSKQAGNTVDSNLISSRNEDTFRMAMRD